MGVGQFCTEPGVVIKIAGEGSKELETKVSELINAKPAGIMLSARTKSDFIASVEKLCLIKGMSVLAGGEAVEHDTQSKPVVLQISAADFLKDPQACQHEAFGHSTVFVTAADMAEVFAVATALTGNLTATRMGTDSDLSSANGMKLRRILETKAGRIITNGMPTGVAVVEAMCHGGPFPACTIDSSSVGGSTRFLRTVAFQNESDSLLPGNLQRGNPGRRMRIVNGQYTNSMIPKPVTK